jgi:hypothetical protein
MSENNLGDLRRAFQWVHAYFNDVQKLFGRTRKLFEDPKWGYLGKNSVYFPGSTTLDLHDQWLPDYHFQFFQKPRSKNLLAVLITHYEKSDPNWTPKIYLVCFRNARKLVKSNGDIAYHWNTNERNKSKKGKVYSGTAEDSHFKKMKYCYRELKLEDVTSLADVETLIVKPLIRLDK